MNLVAKAVALFVLAFAFVAACLFVPAGTLDYWQGWAYIAVVFVPAAFVIAYFLKTDPAFLKRRMQYKEKEAAQKKIVPFTGALFLLAFIIPGLDQRFHWTAVPPEVSIAADVLVLLGYALCALVFKENPYASRVIEVTKGQKLVTTGLYAVVRHPMYLAVSVMYLATPVALGSWLALLAFAPIPFLLALRVKNEEEVLLRKLPGYAAYKKKTRWRIVPYVW